MLVIPRFGVAELPLDHDQRDAFVRHLDCVSVSQLVRREAPSDTRRGGRMMQLLTRSRCLPPAPGGRAMHHAQHRADRELATDLQPRVELLPRPTVHPHLATFATLPAADQHRAAALIQIALLERERFADPQTGAPEQDDNGAQTMSVGSVADGAHNRDDLLDRGGSAG